MSKHVKVRVFSDRPIDINIIWIIVVILLTLLSVFLGYKYSQGCPDVVCPEFPEQKECPNLDCTTCPEKPPVEKEVIKTVTKYVCPNMVDVVDAPDDCVKKDKTYDVTPIKTNEEGTFIVETMVNPACIKGLNGGEVSHKIATTPKEIIMESKEIGAEFQGYTDIKTFPGLIEKSRYFTVCAPAETKCKEIADFYLEKHKLYLLRIKFDETTTTGKIEYSNEYLIDTTSDSDYLTKKCN
jgi:hypothetical protein|tara:strand:+ start:1572 stop:2288 length:717 start_codon:yes stop_codon:yes gene_type:complete